MSYFLLEYDRIARQLLRLSEFGLADVALANKARLQAELEAFRLGRDVEVVLLEARSLDVLKETHGSYFRTEEEYFPAAAAS